MKKFNLSKVLNDVKRATGKHSPEILTALGIVGMITTVVLAVKETPKAVKIIEEEKKKQGRRLKNLEVVKVTWKCYVPAAVTGIMSTTCIIGAQKVNLKRNAAIATAYTISEKAMKEYKTKVIEKIGVEKEKEITDEIAKDKVVANPITPNTIIMGKGDYRCYDAVGGRYFWSDYETLRKVQNDLNEEMINYMYVSLNRFYEGVGLSVTDGGEVLGWNINYGQVSFDYSSVLDESGAPCLVVRYTVAPRYDYTKLM